MRRRLMLAGLAAVVVATASGLFAGRPGVVRLGNGEIYEGEITEKTDEIVIRAHGVDTVITRDRVAGIDYTSYAARVAERLAALAPDDVAGRVLLAREAFERHEDEIALKAVASAIEIDPMHREARQLEAAISSQIQLEARTAQRPTPATAAGTEDANAEADPSPTTRATGFRRVRGLSEDQANRIRQLELSTNDIVRIQFRNNVRKRFVDSQPGMNYRAFASRSDIDQAMTILSRGAPEMQDDVIIRGDPISVQTFGRKIQTALVQGCASSNCHGGNQAGEFRLMAGTPDASTMITNFYLVTQYAKKVETDDRGIFSPPSVPLVDRGNARDSLLYQYALPRALAKHKHPQVRGWDGLIRGDDDRLARELVQWMEVDLPRLPPDYGFTFTLGDRRGAATESATEPATQPTTSPDASQASPQPN